jgi:phage shock protein PspC (stress-responsive transcriptional regulator)
LQEEAGFLTWPVWEVNTMALYRSRRNKVLGGVCGGLAEWLGWNPTLTRVLFVIVSIFSAAFPGILVYILLWIAMPEAPAERWI